MDAGRCSMLDALFIYITSRLSEAERWLYQEQNILECLLCLAELALVVGAIVCSVFALSLIAVYQLM